MQRNTMRVPLGIAHLLAPSDLRAPLLWAWNQPRRANPHMLLFAARDAEELIDRAIQAALVFSPLPGLDLKLQHQKPRPGDKPQWQGSQPQWAYAGEPALVFPHDPEDLRPFLEERAGALWAEALAALRVS